MAYEIYLQILINGLLIGVVYGLIALGMSLVYGVTGVLNISHGSFYMLGGFAAYVTTVTLGYSPVYGLILSFVSMLALSSLIERYIVEATLVNETNPIFVTLGIAIIIEQVANVVWGTYPKSSVSLVHGNLALGAIFVPAQNLLVALLSLFLYYVVWTFIKRTKDGRAIRMVAENSELSRTFGVDVRRTNTISFGLGSALAGLSGGLLSMIFLVFPGDQWNALIIAMVIVVLGGMGEIWGTLVAGIAFGVLDTYTQFVLPRFATIDVLALTLVILLIRPYGLLGKKAERV
jgi:branched-chain amino acid transport system permease protein